MPHQLRSLARVALTVAAFGALAGAGQAATGALPGAQVAQAEPAPAVASQHDQTASAENANADEKPPEPRRAVRVIYPSPYEARRP